MPDPIDLDHIDRLLAEATPGPWWTRRHELPAESWPVWVMAADKEAIDPREEETIVAETEAPDAALIAALVTAAPAMVAELRRLKAENSDAWAAMGPDVEGASLGEAIRHCARAWMVEAASQHAAGAAEERAAIVPWRQS